MKRKSVAMTVVAVAVLLAGIPAFAKGNKEDHIKADLIIGNGTGGEITKLTITPARAKYQNQNCLVFKKLAISDTAIFAVALPDQFKGIDSFDIEMISGGKRYKNQKEVNINFKSGKLPTLELSLTGKDSTRALIGAAAGGVGGVVVADATATALSGTVMETFLTRTFSGPSIIPDLFGFFTIPVVLGTGCYLIGRALTTGKLDFEIYYS